MADWEQELQAEFDRASLARAHNHEGQARVCARRAAGIAVREYLSRRGIRPPSKSAYDLLNLIKDDPLFPPELQPVAEHLTVRVTEEFKLPMDVDLVAEAKLFCARLLENKSPRA